MSSLVFSIVVTLRGEMRLIAVDKGVLIRYLDIIRTNCQEDKEN
jgi:hypothetical protein